MESREGGGPREAGGGWGQALSPPLPQPERLRPRLLRGAPSASRPRGRSPWGARRRPVGRLAQAAGGGLLRALTPAFSSDAAAAAGASLPPPPGRWRGADPQRHLGRCAHLRRPHLFHPTAPLPARLLSSSLSVRTSSPPPPQASWSAATSLLLTSFLSLRITTITHFLRLTLLHYTVFL